MENRRIFIGNLSFSVTADEVKGLLSQFGAVITVKLNRKKGYAFIELDSTEAAEQAVGHLDGFVHRERALRVSFEMKARTARSAAVQRYKERGAVFARQRAARYQPEKQYAAGKPSQPRRAAQGGDRPVYTRAPRPDAGFAPRRGPARPCQREQAAAPRPARRAWPDAKPSHPRRPAQEGGRPAYKRPSDSPWPSARPSRSAMANDAGGNARPRRARPSGGTTGTSATQRASGGPHGGSGRPLRQGARGAAGSAPPSRPASRGGGTRSGKYTRKD